MTVFFLLFLYFFFVLEQIYWSGNVISVNWLVLYVHGISTFANRVYSIYTYLFDGACDLSVLFIYLLILLPVGGDQCGQMTHRQLTLDVFYFSGRAFNWSITMKIHILSVFYWYLSPMMELVPHLSVALLVPHAEFGHELINCSSIWRNCSPRRCYK